MRQCNQPDKNDNHFSESLPRGVLAWLTEFQELTQRRQLRRVRMWDPRPDKLRHLCVAQTVRDGDSRKGQEGGNSARCLRPR